MKFFRTHSLRVRLWPTRHWYTLQVGPDGTLWRWHWHDPREPAIRWDALPPDDPPTAGDRVPRKPHPPSSPATATAEEN